MNNPDPEHNGHTAGAPYQARDEISAIGIVNFLLRHRRLLVALPVVFGVVVVATNMTRQRSWTASAAFVPQSSGNGRTELAGLAAQFGVAFADRESGHSPEFYVQLVNSRTILVPLARTPLDNGNGRKRALLDIYSQGKGSPQDQLDRALRKMRRNIAATTSRETGVIQLDMKAPTPMLAAQAVKRTLELLNEFNVQMRQSQARAEREFSQARLANVRRELHLAESRQQVFLQRNRQWRSSPELTFQYERLDRDVSSRAALVNALEQRYEQARIDEVRATPVITIMEAPSVPVRPDARNTVGRGLLALIVGFVVAVLISLLREVPNRAARAAADEYERFVELRRDAVNDLMLRWTRARRIRAGADGPPVHQEHN